ncbi:MAG: DUF1109 domain-containing protein [Ramlibacter sp.]|nr:DUF1109 domain-containing protein [Ramlibacter sp.]
MKTDDLISLLAADTAAVPRRAASRQIALAMAAGIPLAILAMLLTMGPRPDLAQAIYLPMFWLKVLFPAAVACLGFVTLSRLARPGVSAQAGVWAIAALVVLLWLMAIAAYAGAPSSERAAMVWGLSWRTCTLSVLMISLPIFVAAFLAVRQLAPTRLAYAGACAGLLSGAAGAAIYAFHCPESALPFMAVWYVAGIAVASGIGAALGPRFLRW